MIAVGYKPRTPRGRGGSPVPDALPRCARCPANGRGYDLVRAYRDRDQSTMGPSRIRWAGPTCIQYPF